MSTFELELDRISLSDFKGVIKNNELLPGRRILQENIETYFEVLAAAGIENLQQLNDALKTKKKVENFAGKYALPLDYLTILRRELSSYFPKSVALSDFPDIDEELLNVLVEHGIRNSKKYFENASNATQRHELAVQTGLDEADLLELACLTDLTRIGGVGPVFARMLYEIGIQRVEDLQSNTAEEVLQKNEEINAQKGYTGVKLSVKDIRYCQDKARFLSGGIQC